MTIEQRQKAIKAEIKKATKEADELREMAHEAINGMVAKRHAAERQHKRENAFAAGMAILTMLFLLLAAAGVATFTG